MSKEIMIDGQSIIDKATLYAELNRKLMPDEDWTLGESLDALDDVLYGGYGTINGDEPVRFIWKNFEQNKAIFGKDFTLHFYEAKLKHPEQFDKTFVQKSINDLLEGKGNTYFEIILEIIASHTNIELVKE